jgi:phosphatidylserine/phosphatidylglycerophosphate/cardiolipin synthase-like enzyme
MLSVLFVIAALGIGQGGALAQPLAPQERLCDPSFQDCRADILTYIAQETVGIDIGYWMITDARYSNALVAAWNRGVRIRVLMDPRCVQQHTACDPQNDQLAAAGIPMRQRVTSGILHWKMILFAGQGQLEFGGANFAPFEFVPETPYVNYTDEVVFYTNKPSLVQSFMTEFDTLWTSTSEFSNYANVSGPLLREYPAYSIDPDLNFPPTDSYRTRAINAYNAEHLKIDVQMFRITDEHHTDAMIAALQRGVPVRLITDNDEYRDPTRLWDAYNVDKMYHAGVHVRLDAHQGIDHEKAVILSGTGTAIFGSSNWTSPSSDSQREHNYFTTRSWIVAWLQKQFDRKWNNSAGYAETKAFVPLPPDLPAYSNPANTAAGLSTSGLQLKWSAGLWAHLYDIYFGTSSNPPLYASNVKLGPSQSSTDYRSFALPTLQPGTTYYWKIVSKTMAYVTAAGPVWSFSTAGSASGGALPSGWSATDVGSTGVKGSSTYASGMFTVTGGGADVWGTADAFQYAYHTLSGDGSIVARVTSIQNTAAWAKAGVMMRSSLSPSSAYAFMLLSAGKGAAFQRRTTNGGSAVNTAGSFSTVPRWVKLTRTGSTVTAYESADGQSWTKVGSDTISFGTTVYVGLAVSSHVTGVLCTATFANVQ